MTAALVLLGVAPQRLVLASARRHVALGWPRSLGVTLRAEPGRVLRSEFEDESEIEPFEASVDVIRSQIEAACRRREELAVVGEEVARFEARREWREQAQAIAKQLRALQTTTSGDDAAQ